MRKKEILCRPNSTDIGADNGTGRFFREFDRMITI